MARNKHLREGSTPHTKEFVKQIVDLHQKGRYSIERIFGDFVEAAACALSNTVDLARAPEREKRYLDLIDNDKELQQAYGRLLETAAQAFHKGGPHDFFGEIWQRLELGSTWRGQFFTPYEVSRMMASMSMLDIKDTLLQRGFITMCEPACGPGGMVAAAAETALEHGLDLKHHFHVTAVDIDPRCVHMTYIVCNLLGIPAVVHHANSLSNEPSWSVWFSQAHVVGGWQEKLWKDRVMEKGRSDAEPALKLAAE